VVERQFSIGVGLGERDDPRGQPIGFGERGREFVLGGPEPHVLGKPRVGVKRRDSAFVTLETSSRRSPRSVMLASRLR
jgi:hypothetical protein